MDETMQEHCGTDAETASVQVLMAPSYLGPHIITTYNRSTDLCQILDDLFCVGLAIQIVLRPSCYII